MESVMLFSAAMKLVFSLSLPLFGAVLSGAVLAGILRVSTQIDDSVIGFAGRFAGVTVLLYFSSLYYSKQVLDFAMRVWGSADFYH